MQSQIRISTTSKLDGIRSWSLQAGDTCPASFKADGSLVDACAGCYAKGGNYRFSNVKAPRAHNREDWKRDAWVDDMVKALDSDRYFRWFDSGDMYALGLAEKILQVMTRTPLVKHWLPTRMYKFDKFKGVLGAMQSLPNVSVRFSSDSVTGEFEAGLHGSVIVPDADSIPADVSLCGAYSREGKCGGCRACWDKSVPVVAYPAHGKSMAKVIRLKLVA
jgi:hypothetical protein